MSLEEERDIITVEDEYGKERTFSVEALLAVEAETYALLTSNENNDDPIIMQVLDEKDGQYLVGVTDPIKKNIVLDAYEIAVDANPAD
ncbi:DUF1292 domain-containing protein [Metabacillus litoralis]|uniref:DUF1292 domain-containing protein n=1 Tax=Metabacillus litoralis TaxID=152268 RepID=UPI000EF6267A|nr:DUF1292 domain-containing protein [Metabacillus litoralis]MCM3160025.1 DUF1292 domain-containing protein [Metabacillus litoralis]MCM3408609.1 DUF1292 domain-containing protein [Metabacillus litoralis]UHA59727.1 DUF1292 domain-containing protein [Metabacillus litoralis]